MWELVFYYICSTNPNRNVKMKKLFYTFFLMPSMFILACTGNKKVDANSIGNDSVVAKTDSVQLYVEEEDKTDYSKFIEKPTRVDTSWGDWEIHARQFYDGKKFVYDKVIYADYAVKINIFKGGKPVFKNYKVDSKSLAGSVYTKGFTLGLYEDLDITPTSVYVGFSYCEPETDNCLGIALALSADGTVRKYEIAIASAEGDMDVYVPDIYGFYAMYVNELSQAKPSAAGIRQVLNKYCTKAFAKQLQNETLKKNLLLGSAQFDYRWLRSLEVHNMDTATRTCIVNYKRADGKVIYKRIHLQLKRGSEYEYLISGVSDADADDLDKKSQDGDEDVESSPTE